MTAEELKAILQQVVTGLDQIQEQVTPEILDQADQIIALLDSPGAAGLKTSMQGIDLPQIVALAKTGVAHLRTLIAGQGKTIRDSAEKISKRPLEMALIAKFL